MNSFINRLSVVGAVFSAYHGLTWCHRSRLRLPSSRRPRQCRLAEPPNTGPTGLSGSGACGEEGTRRDTTGLLPVVGLTSGLPSFAV